MNLFRILIFQFCVIFAISVCHAATVTGIKDPEVLDLVKSQLSDWSDVSENSISPEFKMHRDCRVMRELLASYGYFDTEISSRQKGEKIFFDVKLNERYKFDDVRIVYIDQKNYRSGLKVGQVFDLIGIPFDSYTDTKQLSVGGDKIADFLKDRGFAFVKVHTPKVVKDKSSKKIKAVYEVELNGQTIIDKTIINIKSKKDPKLLEPFIRNRISWKDGEIYDRQKIDNLKNDLMSSRIFSGVTAKLSDPIKDTKSPHLVHVTITLDIEEALLRDIAAGLKYGSSEKFGILLSWTHYNIDGKGSSLSATLDATKKDRNLRFKYDIPDIFYKKQRLSNQVYYKKENVSSYDVTTIGAESMLWQTFGMKFNAGVGVCIEESETTDKTTKTEKSDTTSDATKKTSSNNDESEFNAVGFPIGLSFDTTEEYLDPQQGIRCRAMITPYVGNLTDITVFTGKASIYLPFKKNDFQNLIVLAIYSKYGSIFSKKRSKIPRNKLFFSGGGNSVRGYGYQKLGPVDDNKKPLGGESVFEIGVEPRFRISENLGLVAFVEGGNVYSRKMTNPVKKLLFGYGVGVRYYTPFGPIRVDVAFPSKIRKTKSGKKIDSMFNLYISVGQAF